MEAKRVSIKLMSNVVSCGFVQIHTAFYVDTCSQNYDIIQGGRHALFQEAWKPEYETVLCTGQLWSCPDIDKKNRGYRGVWFLKDSMEYCKKLV